MYEIHDNIFRIFFCNSDESLQDEFPADGVDLYDDIGGAPEASSGGVIAPSGGGESPNAGNNGAEGTGNAGSNGVYHQGAGSLAPNQAGRRFQLYVGNLTWVSYT